MGLRVSHPNGDVATSLEQTGQKSVRGGADVLREGAKKIADRAREYAPVDEGNLEAAIHAGEDRGGINRRVRTYVEVADQVNGVRVEDYALEMHESVYNLGPKSAEKAAQTGKAVGRKYLERAADDFEDEIAEEFERLIERMLD